MYRVDGSPDLDEESLDHLEGYRGSRPVRIGNGAADQLQLDIYGEALDSIYLADAAGLDARPRRLDRALAASIDWLCEHWDQPDDGIWETRGGRQDFTYGRLMSGSPSTGRSGWPARAAGPADLPRWTTARDAIYQQIMERGWNHEREAFVQHYDTDVLDASLL